MERSKAIRRFSVDTSTAGRLSYAVVTSQRSLRSLLRIGIAFALIFPALGGVEWRAQAAPAAVCPVRIMPLGDSITVGKYSGNDTSNGADADDIGYRWKLKDLLTTAGYSTDFVGFEENGQEYLPPFTDSDYQHEGHNGITDDQVAANIYNDIDNSGGANWLSLNPPDIILLHIGTNSLSDDPDQVEDILDEIDEYEGDTGQTIIVILALIINRVPVSGVSTIFNDNLEDMAWARGEFNSTLFLVDMEPELDYQIQPAGDFIDDGLHPWSTGYDKMADVWFDALDPIIPTICDNVKPSIEPIADRTDDEDDLISLQVQANDPDPGDTLTYTADPLPPGLSINSESGLISGTISYDASTGNPSQYNVVVTVNDDKPGPPSDEETFTWTVNNTNRAPTFNNPPGNQSHAEGQYISLLFSATDPDGDDLTYNQTGLPPGLDIDASTGEVSGTIAYTAYTEEGYSVEITVTDNGLPTSQSAAIGLTWSVSNTNQPPEFTDPPGDQNDAEGDEISLPFTANDPDGDTLTYDASGLPPGLTINPLTGVVSGTIDFTAFTGNNYSVLIEAADTGSPQESATTNLIWAVSNTNQPPVFVNPPGDRNNDEGDNILLPITADDPDEDILVYTSNGLPLGLSLDPAQGLITGTLASGSAGTYTVTITVSDGLGGADLHEFVWVVTLQVTPEIFVTYLPLTVEQGP